LVLTLQMQSTSKERVDLLNRLTDLRRRAARIDSPQCGVAREQRLTSRASTGTAIPEMPNTGSEDAPNHGPV